MKIVLETYIQAPLALVFDLGRDLDLHKKANVNSNEKIIAGRKHGLVESGDIITWEAKHFGLKQQLKVKVDELIKPYFFTDHMLKGPFKYMQHMHKFEAFKNGTKMTDIFTFSSPFGIIGRIVDRLFLKRYMTKFLKNKNSFLKETAELNTL